MTTSFPAVGLGGLGAAAWASSFGFRDGIVEDYLGKAMSMTFDNTTNEAVFSSGGAASGESYVSSNGYTLVVKDGDRAPLPVPASGAVTYHIGHLYDPQLQKTIPNPDPTQPPLADPLGPCRLVSLTDPGTQVTGGQRFLIVYSVTRTTAALTGAVVVDRRAWVGTCFEYPWGSPGATPGNEGDYPRGSIRFDPKTNGGRVMVRALKADGSGLEWRDPYNDDPKPFPLASGLVVRANKGTTPLYERFSGNRISLSGQIQKSNGGNLAGSDLTLGTMPVGARPAYSRAFQVKCGGPQNYTEVRVNSDGTTDGKVIMTDPISSSTWVDISPISYRIGA